MHERIARGDDVPGAPPMARRERLLVAALLAVHALLAWLQRVPAVTTVGDDANYLWLARAIRSFRYVDAFLPTDVAHVQYPPGYPALLAGVSAVVGERIDALVLVSLVAAVAGLALFHLAARRHVGAGLALTTTALLAISPALTANGGALMSEAPFLAFLALALYGLSRPEPRLQLVLGCAGVLGAVMVRSAGAPFAAALVLHFALQRRWRAVGVSLATVLAPAIAWQLWTASQGDHPYRRTYFDDLTNFVQAPDESGEVREQPTSRSAAMRFAARTSIMVRSYARDGLPTTLSEPSVPGTPIDNYAWLLLNVACLGAGAWLLARRWRALALFLAGYALLLLAWSWSVPRFLEPVLPMLVVTWLTGAAALSRLATRREWVLPALFVATVGAYSVVRQWRATTSALACDRAAPLEDPACFADVQRAVLMAAREFARDPGAGPVVISSKAPMVGWYSGKRVLPADAALRRDADGMRRVLEEYGIRRIIIGRLHTSDRQLAAALLPMCAELHVRQALPGGTWLLEWPAPEPPGDAACSVLMRRSTDPKYSGAVGRW